MTQRRTVLTTLGATLALTALTQHAKGQSTRGNEEKEAIAILGTGNLGKALRKVLGEARPSHHLRVAHARGRACSDCRQGHGRAGFGAEACAKRQARRAASSFALPWSAVADLVSTLGDLDGKVVIDPMNAVKMVDGYPEQPPELQTSVGEQLQAWLPKARVVKAFNTPGARNIANPKRLDGPISIALAGADVEAKTRVAALVSELGLEPVDTGPLIAARYLEGMMRLSLGYFFYTKRQNAFEFYLRPVPR